VIGSWGSARSRRALSRPALSRPALARRLVLVAVAALIPVLAGCEAGNNAPTLDFHYPTDAGGTVVGDLSIRNVFVLGAPLGRNLVQGQSAGVFLALVNNGAPDKLISISAPGTAASVTLPGGIPIRVGHPVFLTGPRPEVVLTDLTRTVTSGSSIRLVLTFQKAGPVTLLVPVMARAAHYVTYAPPQPVITPSPTPSPTPGRHHRGHATPSPSVSPNPTISPSPSASTTG
jgi:copper(I)-binding protein